MMKLYVPQNIQQSEIQKNIMIKEIEKINEEYPIEEGTLDFKKVYLIETDDGAEAQIYIRNNTGLGLNIEGIPVHLTYKDSVIGIVCPNFNELKEIPSRSVASFVVKFKHEDIYYPEFLNEADLVIGAELKVEETIEVDIDNLPETLDYDQREHITSFMKSLKNLRVNKYDINAISCIKGEDESANIIILIRNGFDKPIEVSKLPMIIYNKSGLPIYNGLFNACNMSVKPESASVFNLTIPGEYIPTTEVEYSEFKVEFKNIG